MLALDRVIGVECFQSQNDGMPYDMKHSDHQTWNDRKLSDQVWDEEVSSEALL